MLTGIIQKYGEFLPISSGTPRLSLCEGSTPLVRLRRLGEETGAEIYAKIEGANPTGSFKDRGMTMAISKAVEAGADFSDIVLIDPVEDVRRVSRDLELETPLRLYGPPAG